MNHFYENIEGWFNFEYLYEQIIEDIPNNSHIVEVGAWMGKSTSFLAVEIINSNKKIKFDVIDSWISCDYGDENLIDIQIKLGNSLYNKFLKNIESVNHIVNPIQRTSEEASKLYRDESLDFVFIDADHRYNSVKKDLECWYPKIKKGGIISGHDYNDDWSGVKKAVDEFFGNVIGEFDCTWKYKKI